MQPAQDGVDALKTAMNNVKTNLDAAEASASRGPQAGGATGEDSLRRAADGGKRSDRRQPPGEAAVHRLGDEAGRYRDGGAPLEADLRLPRGASGSRSARGL